MCGIAGHLGPARIPEARIEACLARMHHRGPDHAAHQRWSHPSGQLDLLHTRLSIIDLDPRANQPFRRGTHWIAVNGELYNYKEVASQLPRPDLHTASDTEVLLAALEAWGPAALDRCEGMWALAWYDEAAGNLTLARDRFGEKPLYVHQEGLDLYFGSEPQFLFELHGEQLPVDVEQVRRFLGLGYRALHHRGRTFFEGLEEFPPATWMRWAADGTRTHERYWAPRYHPDEAMTYEQAVAGTRERLLRAVELRLRADVPLAFCMSGGVDSNALLGIAKRVFGHDVHGFTIFDDDPRYDERALVEQSVRELGIRHTAVRLQCKDSVGLLRELIRKHQAPVATISYLAHALLMEQVAAHGYRIAISGTGADELFTGYYDHHLQYLREVRGDPARHAQALAAWRAHVRPIVRNPHLRDPELFVRDPGFREHLTSDSASFHDALLQRPGAPWEEQGFAPDLLRNRMLNELLREVVPVILHEDDLNAMAFSIENRSPYLDRELLEFTLRIPTRHLIRDGFAKAVLRDAVAGIVPEAVRTSRRKVGFNASLASFFDPTDPAVRAAFLGDGPIFDLVRRDKIEALLDRPQLTDAEGKFLFAFLSCKLFLEEFGS